MSPGPDTPFNVHYPKFGSFMSRSTPLALLLIIVLGVFLCGTIFITYVLPHEFGIRQVRIGVNRGIQQEVYGPGWTFVIPGMSQIHIFPRGIQIFDLTGKDSESSGTHPRDRAAHIQTSDGFFVDVDVSILYRIRDPYKLITTLGPGTTYIANGIIPRAEPILKQALGTLTTEEFYNSPLRSERVRIAKKLLQEQVGPKGLEIEDIFVRYFRYSPEIQRNIEEKKLKDQLVFKNQAEKRAATEEALLKKAQQEGEAQVAIKLQEGQSYITLKRADQDLYVRKRRAEGDLQVKLSEAYRTELKNKALEGAGSSRMVGLKMAEVLDGLQLIMLSSDGANGFNPLNLNSTMKMFTDNESSQR